MADASELSIFLPELRACLDAGLPMICANPDLVVMRAGVRLLCAGTLAAWYGEQGGQVRSLGKPHPAIYGTALAMMGARRDRVLAIGDSLHTDIAGAAGAGLDSVWVLGGIHEEEVADEGAVERLVVERGLAPTRVMHRLAW